MNKRLVSAFISVIITQTLFGQRQILCPNNKFITDTKIDNITQTLIDDAGVTGLSVGIVNDDKIVYIKSFGYSKKQQAKETTQQPAFMQLHYQNQYLHTWLCS